MLRKLRLWWCTHQAMCHMRDADGYLSEASWFKARGARLAAQEAMARSTYHA